MSGEVFEPPRRALAAAAGVTEHVTSSSGSKRLDTANTTRSLSDQEHSDGLRLPAFRWSMLPALGVPHPVSAGDSLAGPALPQRLHGAVTTGARPRGSVTVSAPAQQRAAAVRSKSVITGAAVKGSSLVGQAGSGVSSLAPAQGWDRDDLEVACVVLLLRDAALVGDDDVAGVCAVELRGAFGAQGICFQLPLTLDTAYNGYVTGRVRVVRYEATTLTTQAPPLGRTVSLPLSGGAVSARSSADAVMHASRGPSNKQAAAGKTRAGDDVKDYQL